MSRRLMVGWAAAARGSGGGRTGSRARPVAVRKGPAAPRAPGRPVARRRSDYRETGRTVMVPWRTMPEIAPL